MEFQISDIISNQPVRLPRLFSRRFRIVPIELHFAMQCQQPIGQSDWRAEKKEPKHCGKGALKQSVGQRGSQLVKQPCGILDRTPAVTNIKHRRIVKRSLQVAALNIRFQSIDLLAQITAPKTVEQHRQFQQNHQHTVSERPDHQLHCSRWHQHKEQRLEHRILVQCRNPRERCIPFSQPQIALNKRQLATAFQRHHCD